MGYAGLPRETRAFLAGLEANNRRDWFEDHRADYDRFWLNAGLDLIEALSVPMDGLRLIAQPKLNASLRRIHRDVRFSKDKRPYDARLHLIFSTGPEFNKVPGVHLHIGPERIGWGAGHYGFTPEALERYRQIIVDPAGRAEFLGLLDRAGQVGCDLDAPDLVKPPKGYDRADWDHLIRRKSVIVRTGQGEALPDWLFTPQSVDRLTEIAAGLAPIAHWLARLL